MATSSTIGFLEKKCFFRKKGAFLKKSSAKKLDIPINYKFFLEDPSFFGALFYKKSAPP